MKNSLPGLGSLPVLHPSSASDPSEKPPIPSAQEETGLLSAAAPAIVGKRQFVVSSSAPPLQKPRGVLSVREFCSPDVQQFLPKILEEERKIEGVRRPAVIIYTRQEDREFDVLELRGEHVRGWPSVILLWVQKATGVYAPFLKYTGKRFFWQDWRDNFVNFDPRKISCCMPLGGEESRKYADMLVELIRAVQVASAQVEEHRQHKSTERISNNDRRRNKFNPK